MRSVPGISTSPSGTRLCIVAPSRVRWQHVRGSDHHFVAERPSRFPAFSCAYWVLVASAVGLGRERVLPGPSGHDAGSSGIPASHRTHLSGKHATDATTARPPDSQSFHGSPNPFSSVVRACDCLQRGARQNNGKRSARRTGDSPQSHEEIRVITHRFVVLSCSSSLAGR